MKITIDDMIINEIIELLEGLAYEKSSQGVGVISWGEAKMLKIARMLKEQLSSEHQQEQTRYYAEQTRDCSDCTRISSDHTRCESY